MPARRSAPDPLQELRDLAARPPSAPAWTALCTRLATLGDPAVHEAVAVLREPLVRWPAPLRRGDDAREEDPTGPWLRDLFAGRCDPRLELLGWAAVHGETRFREEREGLAEWRSMREAWPLVVVLARSLDPSFDPPDVLLSREHEYTSAYGCGGGFDQDVRGDATRGARWYDRITEHAADDSSAGVWTVYGLPEGCSLELGRYERGRGAYTFAAAGPCPQVLELALAWGALMRPGVRLDLERARQALADARLPWRG